MMVVVMVFSSSWLNAKVPYATLYYAAARSASVHAWYLKITPNPSQSKPIQSVSFQFISIPSHLGLLLERSLT
jgi:hypothetical protein